MTSPKSLPKPKKPKLPLLLRRVSGDSMLPGLPNGKVVLIYTWRRNYRIGNVVMVSHNGMEKIKRIQNIKDGKVFVVGDNPNSSTDSRQFGWLPLSHVQGRVVGRRLNQASSAQQ